MKSTLLEVLRQSASLMALYPDGSWYERGSITDIPTPRRFAVLASTGTVPGIGSVRVRSYEIWFHDEPGTYDVINEAIEMSMDHLDGTHAETDDAYVLSVEVVGASPDLEDDGYRTIARSLSLRVVGRRR